MIFRSESVRTTWDTWMYYANDTYYLYYLITETSPGEGFGVAVSKDGVHFKDKGPQLTASKDMVIYLGTGAVWPNPTGKYPPYYCNYSEWRRENGSYVQTIHFAESNDLIHWKKRDDIPAFRPDSSAYRLYDRDGARWDCIYPIKTKSGGYMGALTASPIGRDGFGLAETKDGLHWIAISPPEIDLTPFKGGQGIEAGAVHEINGRIYAIIGCYTHPFSMGIFTADTVTGPYLPQKKNFAFFSNREVMHAYFARFLEKDDDLLVNFHVLSREYTDMNRPYTWLAPLKKAVTDDEGILRLMWWNGNEALYGDPIDADTDSMILETFLHPQESVRFLLTGNTMLDFSPDEHGVFSVRQNGRVLEWIDRALPHKEEYTVRLLLRGRLTEWYVENTFALCYTLPADMQRIESPEIAKRFRMKL